MTDLQSFTLMMASAQVVETSVNTNNIPQDYTTNPDDHSNHNIKSSLLDSVFCGRIDNRIKYCDMFFDALSSLKNLEENGL